MTKSIIKNCPFCNGLAECLAESKDNIMYKVSCCECFCQTDLYDHPEIAKRIWNCRIKEVNLCE